jgi:transcriptional regulator GlxA family with amidase domain
VDREVLYVDEGNVVTSAGSAAGIDCCLHLLRRWQGAEIAGRVARRLVVPPHRQGGQAQYIETPLAPDPEEGRLSKILAEVERNLGKPHRLDDLAGLAHLSRRTFTRRFRQTTGTTFAQWLLHRRLQLAQKLLEVSRKPISLIAEEAGFGSEVSLRSRFTQILKTSPARYRREFGGK